MATAAPFHTTPAHNLSKSARAESAGLASSPSSAATSSSSSSSAIPHGDVDATLTYFAPPADGAAPYNYVEQPPAGVPARNYGDHDAAVTIHDIRGHEADYTLDRDAFAVVQGQPPSAEDAHGFTDDASIARHYYPELERLLLAHVPGATRVLFFDHTIRRADPSAPRNPVVRVHIDQTAKAAEERVRRHVTEDGGAEAERLLRGRYRIINVWRPLNGPVASFPLAFASSATARDADLVPIEHRYPTRTGETAGVRHHPAQRWHYLSGMRNDERLLLECFDSEGAREGSGVQGGRVPHTAFVHPGTPEGAPGRESIEVRALVFGP